MGFFANIKTSMRLTGASFKWTFTNPIVFLLPLFNLIWMGLLVWGPIAFFIWHAKNFPDAAASFWGGLYFITKSAAESGNWELAVTSAVIETYILYAVWLSLVLWGSLYFITVGMDMAKQAIPGDKPSMAQGFKVANRNLGRLLLMAIVMATLISWVRYLVRFTIGLVPIVGRWVNRAISMVLTAVTYLMLPIIVYERAGPITAMRSAWTCVRKTWSGMLIGGAMIYGAMWIAFNVVMQSIMEATVGIGQNWDVALIISLSGAAILYSIAVANGATMRAILYVYATTGEVPVGFNKEDLPATTHTGPISPLAA